MADKFDSNGGPGEEIEGAPPAISRAELRASRLTETYTVNRYLYQQTQQMELMLLGAPDLLAVFQILLVSLPRHFSFQVSELWLHDPEDELAGILVGAERYGQNLQLLGDVMPLQELYEPEADVALIDATDSRMFEVLKFEHGIDCALLMPLEDSGRVFGSLHLGLQEESLMLGEAEESLLSHLAAIISACLRSAVSRQQITQLALVDELTRISNPRGFKKDLSREISRARRGEKPVALLCIEIDEFGDLFESYGERRGQFVVKKVAERLASNLRATDLLARLGQARFALLVPGGGEVVGREVGERMRRDIEGFSIDDGRGAILQVTISAGLVCWEPLQFPAVDMEQLALQMETVGDRALEDAQARGGNEVALSRLTTMSI